MRGPVPLHVAASRDDASSDDASSDDAVRNTAGFLDNTPDTLLLVRTRSWHLVLFGKPGRTGVIKSL